MQIELRQMRPSEAEVVVEMVATLALGIPAPRPKLDADTLRAETAGQNPMVDCVVAAKGDALMGCCVTTMAFSTWRNMRGIYVSDIYVIPQARKLGLGKRLLAAATARGWERGARFIRLDADVGNHAAHRFYERLGFHLKTEERIFFLENDATKRLLAVERPLPNT